MVLSVIIPTYKRNEILPIVLQHLANALVNINAEIIVINDDKQNQLLPISINKNDIPLNIYTNKKAGAAAARNYGSNLAKGDILLFLDDDIIIDAETISSILKIQSEYDKIISTPIWEYSSEMKLLLSKNSFGKFRLKYDYVSIRGRKNNETKENSKHYLVDSLASFCLSIKKKHFIQLNGMDDLFPFAGCEDQEFSERAKQNGFILLLDENNTVLHHEIDRIQKSVWLKRQYNGVQGFVRLANLYPDKKKFELWYENTPISKSDSAKLKIKKVLKKIARQNFSITIINSITYLLESLKVSYFILEKIYLIQTGIYINKGFNNSYENLTHSNDNG